MVFTCSCLVASLQHLEGLHTKDMLNSYIEKSHKTLVILKLHDEDVLPASDPDMRMRPVDSEIATKYAAHIDFYKLDVDNLGDMSSMLNPNAANTPVYLFFKGGKPMTSALLNRQEGGFWDDAESKKPSKAKFSQVIDSLL